MDLKIPPKLNIQIWDNDKFSLDDYLGKVTISSLHTAHTFTNVMTITQLLQICFQINVVSIKRTFYRMC